LNIIQKEKSKIRQRFRFFRFFANGLHAAFSQKFASSKVLATPLPLAGIEILRPAPALIAHN